MARTARSTFGPAQVFPEWPSDQLILDSYPEVEQAAAFANEISFRIRQRRKELKMTQEMLAQKAGISLFTVTNVERGKTWADLHTIGQILGILGLIAQVTDLLGNVPRVEMVDIVEKKKKKKGKKRVRAVDDE
jgi:DNA-binding XRE family transcriptional regulator